MRATVVALLSAFLFALQPMEAQSDKLTVEIAKVTTLLERGSVVEVDVNVTCRTGSMILEALVYITQNGNQSHFASIPVRCRGRARPYAVKVSADGFVFTRGAASASAYVLVQSSIGGATESGDDNRNVEIR